MIIKPYSAIVSDGFNESDYPCVKHFFKCDEAAGATAFVDSVGGVSIDAGGAITKPDANGIQLPVTTARTTTGTFSTPGTKYFVLFAVAQFSTATAFKVGNAPSINLKQTAPLLADAAANNWAATNFTLVTAATTYGRAMVVSAYNSATGQQTYEFNTTDTATALAATATNAPVALTDGTAIALGTGATGFVFNVAAPIFGIAWMEFTTIPANLKAGLAWMTYQWANGNKVIYPGFKGLS